MAILAVNPFSSYELTVEEEVQGSLLTITQKQMLQNDLAIYATQRLALEFDPLNPSIFVQREAGLKGQMEVIQYLLDRSNAVEEAIKASSAQPEEE